MPDSAHLSWSAPTASADWDSVLSQNTWYASLPHDFRAELLALAHVRTLEPGQHLFRRDNPPCGLYAVLQGSIRICALSGPPETPRETLLTPMFPGAWFGEISLFDERPRSHDAYAPGDARVLQCSQGALESLLARQPTHWRSLGRLMSARLRNNLEFTERMLALPMRARIAYRILQLAREMHSPATPDAYTVAVTQHELAMMLGCTRQTVNTLLAEMQAMGWVVTHRGKVMVLDTQALQYEAFGEPAPERGIRRPTR